MYFYEDSQRKWIQDIFTSGHMQILNFKNLYRCPDYVVSYLDVKLLSISTYNIYTTTHLTGNSGQKYTISTEKKKGEKMRDLHNVYVCILVFT